MLQIPGGTGTDTLPNIGGTDCLRQLYFTGKFFSIIIIGIM